MNIVQLHEKVRFWLDFVGSARFDSENIDTALNSATNMIQKEKYDKTKVNHNSETFERTQAVRDELREFVKFIDKDSSPSITLTNNPGYVAVTDLPDDYRYNLYMELFVGTQGYEVNPFHRNRKTKTDKNPFRKVEDNIFNRCYFKETESGIEIFHPFAETAPTNVKIEYLKAPDEVYFGEEHTTGGGTLEAAIATITPTKVDGTEYKIGDEFVTASPIVYSYGSYTQRFTNPELNSVLHEELALRAAINCLISAGYKEKAGLLKAEIQSF